MNQMNPLTEVGVRRSGVDLFPSGVSGGGGDDWSRAAGLSDCT